MRTPIAGDAYSGPPALGTGANQEPPLISRALTLFAGTALTELFADERFRIVTETMVDGLIVINAVGTIKYVNPACERLFGYAEGGLIGRSVSALMPDHHARNHDGYLQRHRDTRVKRIIGVGRELTGLRSDGSQFPMYLSVGETYFDGETSFVGIIYDLTEKKRTEEVILHHQKLDAIGQLSGGIAHDFNNILSVIGGNLEMVSSADLPPSTRRAVARAQEAVLRAGRITQRLLAFARRQPLMRQAINLNQALDNLADMLRRSVGETVLLKLQLNARHGVVEADIDQFETAILNLAFNARDAMKEGGELIIETEDVAFDETPRMNAEVPPGVYVRVSVSDNGEGMPPDVVERAVEPFFTTKDVGAGTGLGLSMVYGFLKQLGGHARIYSELGSGTRVSLYFPKSEARPESLAVEETAHVPAGQGETILVVEDDPDVQAVTVARLQDLGYSVLTADDGPSALSLVRETSGIDMALVDVVMPGGMDGHRVADEIAALDPGIRLAMTSGYSARMATGPDRPTQRPFLSKPASTLKLARLVRRVLDAPD
jgi:PAS domain S-box-containing protein